MESESIEIMSKTDSNPKTKNKNCKPVWIAILLLLVICLGLAAGGIFFYQQTKHYFSSYQRALMQMEEKYLYLQSAYQNSEKNLSQVQNILASKLAIHDDLLQLIVIKKLTYLAQYNLLYLYDQDSALSALQTADRQLTELGKMTNSLESLRNLLTNNISLLEALPHLNISGTLAQLSTLQKKVNDLPLLNYEKKPSLQIVNTSSKIAFTESEKWLNILREILQAFRQLIIIRHLDKPIKPLLPEEQQKYLRYNLQLLLQQTQWAFLRQDQEVYQVSLQNSQTLIAQYFDKNATVTQSLLEDLQRLAKINLRVKFPDLKPTLEAITKAEKELGTHSDTTPSGNTP